jgi:Mrp family chromosome partitioning ATPase
LIETEPDREVLTLRDYFEVISRRRWTILATAVGLALLAVLFSALQQPLYRSSLDVLLNRQTPLQELTAGGSVAGAADPARFVTTQAELARAPVIADRVIQGAGVSARDADEFLRSSSVTPIANADVLRFEVTDTDPDVARRLTAEYGEQFRIYRRRLDRAQVEQARSSVAAAIEELDAAGGGDSALRATLLEQRAQLRTLQAGLGANVRIVSAAETASTLRPEPVRAGTLAFFIGLVVGLLLAFLREALDSRVRSADEARRYLGLPLIGNIPTLPRRRRATLGVAMMAAPYGSAAEAFWSLRTRLELADAGERVIMIASAVTGEGKSTTAANLAIAIARGGRRVILAEFDLRRPSLGRLFDVGEHAGLTDVVSGRVDMEEALITVAIRAPGHQAGEPVDADLDGSGTLQLLTSGSVPIEPARLLTHHALTEVIRGGLAGRADVVLIDTPGMLEYGDALAISGSVDAALVIARLGASRRRALAELRGSLESAPVTALGLVTTGGSARRASSPPAATPTPAAQT